MMTVWQLIDYLQTLPHDLPVAYRCFSEQCLMEPNEIKIGEAGVPREDGWIHDARPDKPSQTYVIFPGN